MIKTVTKTVERYICDCCGKEMDDKTDASVTAYCGGEVWFEWWPRGDYCNDCARLLVEAIASRMGVPERYSKKFRDDMRKVDEIAIIALEREVIG